VSAKDVVLTVIRKIGIAGGTGCTIEYAGSTVRSLSMERPHDPMQHVDRGGARAPA